MFCHFRLKAFWYYNNRLIYIELDFKIIFCKFYVIALTVKGIIFSLSHCELESNAWFHPFHCRCDNNDFLEIFHSGRTAGDSYSVKHCGRRFPGPILAHKQLEIQFISRRNSKNSTGFEARFEFVHPDSLNTGNCYS